jgi:hypothetical protein
MPEKADFWSVLLAFWNLLSEFHDWSSWVGILLLFIVAAVAIMGALYVAHWSLQKLAAIAIQLRKLRGELERDQTKRLEIKRRQQFCRVLRSDLDVIAKAENWNDQWFADLEAEVRAEGVYYASPLEKLLRRRVSGSRKEPSLMAAISNSSERCLLLVGEPGSGKSVALRHLAHQLTEDGIQSKSASALVPLYVNLRELADIPEAELCADRIKQFVLENVRRGDADTASYVREKWQQYINQGVWFFLFDSFDEIPAVLHAATGSNTIKRYSDAVRQFMSGMGNCRGILASREFKGPESIPWRKLIILALDSKRQSELIVNAMLSAEQQKLVHRHLVNSDATFRNPLFLSLLCRYVRDNNRPPAHDYDLVYRQIERLANRDIDHLRSRYQLEPADLMEGAKVIAACFALNEKFGLAPKWEALAEVMRTDKAGQTRVLDLLAALVDLKIGRADVKEAKTGDRRFAFAHRRYQETLFVDYLAANPSTVSARELLLDARWREYAVTFLQSQPLTQCEPLIAAAQQILEEWSAREPTSVLPEFGGHGAYFCWDRDRELHLLPLLQQGLHARQESVASPLQRAAERFLMPRWNQGDAYDRWRVLTFASLMPSSTLERLIGASVDDQIHRMREAAFAAAGFVRSMPQALSAWVRQRLADDTLLAQNSVELSKVELLGAKLPSSLQSLLIFDRCVKLRKIYRPVSGLLVPAFNALNIFSMRSSSHRDVRQAAMDSVNVYMFFGALLCISLIAIGVMKTHMGGDKIWWATHLILAAVAMVLLRLTIVFWFRAAPLKLTLTTVCSLVGRLILKLRSQSFMKHFLGFLAVTGAGIAAVSAALHWYPAAAKICLGVIYALGMGLTVWQIVKSHRAMAQGRRALLESAECSVLRVRTRDELNALLSKKNISCFTSLPETRSLLRLLDELPLATSAQADKPLFKVNPGAARCSMKDALVNHVQMLEDMQEQSAEKTSEAQLAA